MDAYLNFSLNMHTKFKLKTTPYPLRMALQNVVHFLHLVIIWSSYF